jgi:hypothetical protein
MLRINNILYLFMLVTLKSELEKKVGFALDSFKNCRRLEQILQQQDIYISYSSLARMFSLGNKTTVPRNSTLNELSVFLGYETYEHFNNQIQNSSDELESYTRKVLEMKSELLLSNRLKGLELFIDIRKNYPILSSWLCQDIALYLFNNQQLPQKDLEHLVANGITEVNFMDHFVYEDDPFGHYEWFIKHTSSTEKHTADFQNFKELFIERKKLLRGKANKGFQLPNLNINQSIHLYSRILEVEILQIAANQPKNLVDYFHERLKDTVFLLKKRSAFDKIIVLGRLFRAASHSGIDNAIILDEETKQFCVDVINSNSKGLEFEFMAPIYAVLKNDPALKLSLAFYQNNHWKNAQFESEMLIAKALGLKKVYTTYKNGILKPRK